MAMSVKQLTPPNPLDSRAGFVRDPVVPTNLRVIAEQADMLHHRSHAVAGLAWQTQGIT